MLNLTKIISGVFPGVSFPFTAVGASGPLVPLHRGRDTAQVVFSGKGWLSMRRPPTVSSRRRDPTGSVGRAGRSTCPAGKVGYSQACMYTACSTKLCLLISIANVRLLSMPLVYFGLRLQVNFKFSPFCLIQPKLTETKNHYSLMALWWPMSN